jgi:uncharacterized protein YggE
MARMNTRLLPALVAFASLAACSPTTVVRGPGGPADVESVTVDGEGDATVSPDLARVQLGVEARAASLDDAMRDATQRMKALRDRLVALGIPEAKLKTSQWSVDQERVPVAVPMTAPIAPAAPTKGGARPGVAPVPSPAPPPAVAERWEEHYRVSNMLEVTVEKLDLLGKVLALAGDAGANRSWGVSFDVADPKPVQAEAREKAVADARARAEQLARLAGVKLGRVVALSEGGGGMPMPYARPMAPMMAKMADAAPVPVERGEIKVHANVHVVYAIER